MQDSHCVLGNCLFTDINCSTMCFLNTFVHQLIDFYFINFVGHMNTLTVKVSFDFAPHRSGHFEETLSSFKCLCFQNLNF